MAIITEYGEMVFSVLDEWGRIRIDGLLEDGTEIIVLIVFPSKVELSGGGWFIWIRKKPILPPLEREVYFPKRSQAASEFINGLREKIMETGVVRNKHIPYNPRTNRRFKVSEQQAARIAYSIAKSKGMRVGRYRGPNR